MVNPKYVAIAACLSVAAACTTKAEHSEYFGKTEPPEGQHMRYISGSEPESLDPPVSSSQPDARDIEIASAGLEQAFLELTAGTR